MTSNRNLTHRYSKGRKIVDKLILSILPVTSWVFMFVAIALEKGSREHMGIYRDMTFRNRVLDATFFTIELIAFYQLAIVIGIVVLGGLFWFAQRVVAHRAMAAHGVMAGRNRWSGIRYLIATLLSSVFLYLLFGYYPTVEWLAYPLICLSMMLVVIIQYLRLFYQSISWLVE